MADPDDLSWLDPSRLELLADDAGLGSRDLRELLRAEIERRQSIGQKSVSSAQTRSEVVETARIGAVSDEPLPGEKRLG